MEVRYSIHTGTHFMQVFIDETAKRCKGSILIQDVNNNMDSVFIKTFKSIEDFKEAIIDVYCFLQVTDDQIVEISVDDASWLALMPTTFNWHNATRIGFNKTEQDDPMSLKNQHIVLLDRNLDWLK